MATANDRKINQGRRELRRKGHSVRGGGLNPAGVLRAQTKAEIVADSKNVVIKPGMKLTWDEELGRMVWK